MTAPARTSTAGTVADGWRVTAGPHAFVPGLPEPGLRPCCRECGGQPGGDHLPTPRAPRSGR